MSKKRPNPARTASSPLRGGQRRKSVGDFVRGGDFSGYWETRISQASAGAILVRGYPVEDLIEHLSYIESLWLIVRGELPNEDQAALLDLVLRSGMDQQFVNSAVCAARFTASAFPESPIPGIASGMLATGSVTGSPQECAEMLVEALHRKRREHRSASVAARAVVASRLRTKGYVPGFGHPLHHVREPRAETLRRLVQERGGWGPVGNLLDAIGVALATAKKHPLPMNLAGAMAACMVDLGWHPLEIGALGAIGYAPALLAHVVEEIRQGVPLRIIPDGLGARYSGRARRPLPVDVLARGGAGLQPTKTHRRGNRKLADDGHERSPA